MDNGMDNYCMDGTYEDISNFPKFSPPPESPTLTATPIMKAATIENLKLMLDNSNKHLVKLRGRPLGEGYHSDEDLEKEEEKGTVRQDTTNQQFIVKEFHISPLISNIKKILYGPPQQNMQLADYISIIPELTGADCLLVKERRLIKITGEEACVEVAWNRWNVIQKSYVSNVGYSLYEKVVNAHIPYLGCSFTTQCKSLYSLSYKH